MNILGISAFYHDSAACIVRDGELVAAAQEERFTRKKHDHRFPQHAVDYCLREAGIDAGELDHVAFYDKPLLKFDRLLETYAAYAPAGFRSFVTAMPLWLRQKLHVPRELDRGLRGRYKGRYVFLEHHESHAASAFFPSPFEEAAILTLDGVGEWATGSYGVGRGNRIELTHELRFPHSLGLLYSAFTYFAGFKVNSGEYKLMGLAPFGEPRFADTILRNLVDVKPDGSFRMDMSYFNYCQGLTMTSRKFDALFEGPPRRAESRLTQREMDIAASVQVVTEEIMLRCARHVRRETGMRSLVMAGGVALNCVANGRIARDGRLRSHLHPAGRRVTRAAPWALRSSCGTSCSGGRGRSTVCTIVSVARCWAQASAPKRSGIDSMRLGARYHHHADEATLLDAITDEIAAEKVVGHFEGRMEFGPRALGARSIIGDARSSKMQSLMNLKTKFRESFRPFAPSVLREDAHEWFDTPPDSPYMLLIADVHRDKRVTVDTREASGADRRRPATEGRAIEGAGDHACGLLGAPADGRARTERALLPIDQAIQGEDRAAR